MKGSQVPYFKLSLLKIRQKLLNQRNSNLSNDFISSFEVTKSCLNQIEELKHLNCFITQNDAEQVLEAAKQSDKKIKEGKNVGALEGIPIVLKDNFSTKEIRTTCASKMLQNYKPLFDSTVWEKLKQEGAILLGKTNMDEFSMGSTSTQSWFGKVVNPWSKSKTDESKMYVAGGSSGGSAVAVASRMSFLGIGSDTGGSVRQPAAFCGIVGLKPTYGRISRWGLVAFASSLDTPGIFTRTVEDSSYVLDILAGYDKKDSNSIFENMNPTFPNLTKSIKNLRVGIPKEYHIKELSPLIMELWGKGIKKLESLGAKVERVSLPHTEYALPAYYILSPAEAYSNLARYDGIKYGFRAEGSTFKEQISNTRGEGFGFEVKRRILIGNFVLSRKSYQSYYLKAQELRKKISQDFHTLFKEREIHVLLTPTTPTPAFSISQSINPVEMYLNDVMTIPPSLAGLPSISVPASKTNEGLPLGLQLIAPWNEEARLLNVAKHLEDESIIESWNEQVL